MENRDLDELLDELKVERVPRCNFVRAGVDKKKLHRTRSFITTASQPSHIAALLIFIYKRMSVEE